MPPRLIAIVSHKYEMKRITVIIIFFSCLFSYQVSVSQASTKVGHAKTQLELLSESIQILKQDIGRYPTEDEGLDLLLKPSPESQQNWAGPYLKKALPNDPWRNKYVYHFPARYGNKDFDLYSFGVNGQDDKGEKDDITNWREINAEYYGGLSKSANVTAYVFSMGVFLLLVACLVRLGHPTFAVLPRRFALTTSVFVLITALWVIFLAPANNGIDQILGRIFIVCIVGFSISGSIISLVSVRKGGSKAKAMLFAFINLMPILIVGGLWLYLEVYKLG